MCRPRVPCRPSSLRLRGYLTAVTRWVHDGQLSRPASLRSRGQKGSGPPAKAFAEVSCIYYRRLVHLSHLAIRNLRDSPFHPPRSTRLEDSPFRDRLRSRDHIRYWQATGKAYIATPFKSSGQRIRTYTVVGPWG